MSHEIIIEESPVSKFLFSNTKMAWFWLIIRMYVGYEWITAGWGKIHNDLWVGQNAGGALTGFAKGALQKMSGTHPDVSSWYGWFLEHAVIPHAGTWSHVIAFGELLVGIALVVGIVTGIAAFFGLFMNLNFLLAGTISTNPILFTLSIGIILAWKTAGYIGLDHYLLPALGTPWHKGKVFEKK